MRGESVCETDTGIVGEEGEHDLCRRDVCDYVLKREK